MSVFKSAKIIFTALRIGGTFPYSFKKVEGTGTGAEVEGIQFRTVSWVTGWTLCMALTKILLGLHALCGHFTFTARKIFIKIVL